AARAAAAIVRARRTARSPRRARRELARAAGEISPRPSRENCPGIAAANLIAVPPVDMSSNRDQPERPGREPESIPPGNDWPNLHSRWPPNHGFNERRSTHRICVGRIGPLGFVLLLLMLALFGGIFLLALIGAALIWFPVLLVFVVIAAVAGLIRRL